MRISGSRAILPRMGRRMGRMRSWLMWGSTDRSFVRRGSHERMYARKTRAMRWYSLHQGDQHSIPGRFEG